MYWTPVWAILEDRFGRILVNARHVKQVPGRRTDVTDAQWLCRLATCAIRNAPKMRRRRDPLRRI